MYILNGIFRFISNLKVNNYSTLEFVRKTISKTFNHLDKLLSQFLDGFKDGLLDGLEVVAFELLKTEQWLVNKLLNMIIAIDKRQSSADKMITGINEQDKDFFFVQGSILTEFIPNDSVLKSDKYWGEAILGRGMTLRFLRDADALLLRACKKPGDENVSTIQRMNSYFIVRLLVAGGIDTNVEDDEDGLSPLMLALKWNVPLSWFLLKRKKTRVNHTDKNGKTVLFHFVTGSGNKMIFKELCNRGIDVEDGLESVLKLFYDPNQQTAITLGEFLFLLDEYGRIDVGKIENILWVAMMASNNPVFGSDRHFAVIKWLMERGADVHQVPDGSKSNCLQISIYHPIAEISSLKYCKYLLQNGADPNKVFKEYNSLHFAIVYHNHTNSLPFVQAIVAHGADLRLRCFAERFELADAMQVAAFVRDLDSFNYFLGLNFYTDVEVADAYDILGCAYAFTVNSGFEDNLAYNYWKRGIEYRNCGTSCSSKEWPDECSNIEQLDALFETRSLAEIFLQVIYKTERIGKGDKMKRTRLRENILAGLFPTPTTYLATLHEIMAIWNLPFYLKYSLLQVVLKLESVPFVDMYIILEYLLESTHDDPNYLFLDSAISVWIRVIVNSVELSDVRRMMVKNQVTSRLNRHSSLLKAYVLGIDIVMFDHLKFLLECGCNPNKVDDDGCTTLHLVLKTHRVSLEVVNLLLDYDAHVDTRNNAGEKTLDLLLNRFPDFDRSRILKARNLKCLAATVIREEEIEYEEVTPSLSDFVSVH